jgi:hypothetical protein
MRGSIFVVEGHTEQIFVRKFIEQMAVLKKIHISWENLHKGILVMIRSEGTPVDLSSHHIRIINVEGDEKVNSFIKDNLKNFKAKGYEIIYGVRDKYTGDNKKQPVDQIAIDEIFKPLADDLKITLKIIVAIEEIEAWFLSVPIFFSEYDKSLTIANINEVHGIDLSSISVESITHPAALIDNILTTVGKRYKKRQDDSYKITDTLDYDTLYLEKSESIRSLNMFVDAIDNALT